MQYFYKLYNTIKPKVSPEMNNFKFSVLTPYQLSYFLSEVEKTNNVMELNQTNIDHIESIFLRFNDFNDFSNFEDYDDLIMKDLGNAFRYLFSLKNRKFKLYLSIAVTTLVSFIRIKTIS